MDYSFVMLQYIWYMMYDGIYLFEHVQFEEKFHCLTRVQCTLL